MVSARGILHLSTLSADIIGYGGVCDQEVFLKKPTRITRRGPVLMGTTHGAIYEIIRTYSVSSQHVIQTKHQSRSP